MPYTLEDIKKAIGDTVSKTFADEWEARTKGGTTNFAGQVPGGQPPVVPEKAADKGINAARCIRYLALSNNHIGDAATMAEKDGHKMVAKALGESTLAGGGALLPIEFSMEVIELLRADAVVRAMGVTSMPMNSGSLTLPFIGVGTTASYVGENTNIQKTEPTFGQLQLSDKKLAALVPTSNDLLRNGGDRVDRVIRDDLVRAMRLKEDITFIRSDGSSNEPTGMLFLADSGNLFDADGTTNLDTVTADLSTSINNLRQNDVDLNGAGWLISSRTWKFLIGQRDGNGNLVWKPEMDQGKLFGFPFMITTQIPENLGGGTDESEIYFCAFPMLVLAENEALQIEVFPGGTYFDGATLISGISQDQTVIRALALHDFGARQRGKEISVIQAVKWGA